MSAHAIIPDDWSTWPVYPVNTKRYREKFTMPLLVWKKEYETNPEKYLDFVRKLSDSLLFAGNSIYDKSYVNHPDLTKIARGQIREADYWEADYVYGQKSFIPLRDNNFFEAAKSFMLGEITGQPFKFITKNINNEYAGKRIKQISDKAAKAIMNVAAQNLQQNGVGAMGGNPFPNVDIRGDMDAVLSRLNPQESVEYVVFALLQHIHYNHDFLDISKNCFDNAFDINARFAGVSVRFGEVVPEHLNPAQVRWLSNGPIKTFEDDGVLAVGYHKYRSIEDTIAEEGSRLFKAHGISGLRGVIAKLRDGETWDYNPGVSYDAMYSAGATHTLEQSGIQRPEYFEDNRNITQTIGWDGNYADWFYPDMYLGGVRRAGVMTHNFYFKMVKDVRMLILVDGKNTTKDAFLKKVRYDFDRKHTVEFRKVDTDYKPQKGEYIVDIPVRTVHQATRIGHSVLVDCGIYEHSTKTNTLKPGYPIVGRIVNEKSFVQLGQEINKRINLLYQRIDEIIVQMGHSTAILIDEAQETDHIGFLYNARRTGIALYNSNKMTGGNSASLKHMSRLDLGTQINELNQLFQTVGMYKMTYDSTVGVSPQVQGVQQKYTGLQQTQLNINSQSVLKQRSYFEHTKFMNDLLQRTADVSKSYYADREEMSLIVDKNRQEVLKMSKDMTLAEIDVYLESGSDLAAKKQKLDDAAIRVLSGSGIDFFEPLLDILGTDNVNEARALWRESLPLIKQQEQVNAQRQNEALQRQAQAIEEKNQLLIEKEQMITERQLELKRMELEGQAQKRNDEGEMKDIDEINDREKKMMDAVLNPPPLSNQTNNENRSGK